MKQKYLFLFFILVAMAMPAFAQNKIGDNPTVIQPASLLELESLTKGLRLPRIALNDVNAWTLDGTAISGMLIFNESGSEPKGIYSWDMDLSKWVRVVNSSELSTLISNYITNNQSVKDSIIQVINNTINNGAIEGKNMSSNSPVIKITNGTGATLSDVQIDIDSSALGHMLTTSPLKDSLAVTISNNTVILDSIKSALNKTTTNQLAINNGNLVSTVNGISSSSVGVIASGNNGLTATNGNIQLGGALTKPTTLTTSASNTLAIKGLEEGNSETDSILVTAPNTGIIKKISNKSLTSNISKSVILAINGQTTFATPAAIVDIKKIQVYRNGVSVEFTQLDGTHIQLDPEAACYPNDEVKIIQVL